MSDKNGDNWEKLKKMYFSNWHLIWWFACSGSGHQHLDQVDSTSAKRAHVQKIVDYLVTTTTSVVGLHNLSRKNWHFVKPLAFFTTLF